MAAWTHARGDWIPEQWILIHPPTCLGSLPSVSLLVHVFHGEGVEKDSNLNVLEMELIIFSEGELKVIF